ncbi:ParA family protein [Mycolicibacter icosiumassiliensis]|jgi:chromosome partitioning protein|uniref:ParA family protein n=1 Tax=Mycolicibacter icosiumassiliensis TaxID=1792835 RepID=UPI00082D71C6|nr:ParA family protein [Mycolicibacter icosiumassiliensis]
MSAHIAVCHSRKGGVGKSFLAYELAFLLGAVLVDLEHDGGGVTAKWGYRPQDHPRARLLDALVPGAAAPRPMRGFKKPALVPGHPELYDHQPDADTMADALSKWAQEWDTDWIVVDTHPGASPAAHGALAVANIVLAPTALRTAELDATAELVREIADYPLVVVPNFVPTTPPAAEIQRLRSIIAETPVQVAPPIPNALHVGTRKRRIAITAEAPPAKSLQKVAGALTDLAAFVKGYVHE